MSRLFRNVCSNFIRSSSLNLTTSTVPFSRITGFATKSTGASLSKQSPPASPEKRQLEKNATELQADSKRKPSSGPQADSTHQNIKPHDLSPDDGSVQMKEKMSPGSVDKNVLKKANAKEGFHDDVPQEARDKVTEETLDMIKKQSGMAYPGGGG